MKVLIRADADIKVGIGHIMRSLALAQASQKFGTAAYVTTSLDQSVEQRLKMENISVFKIDAVCGSDEDAAATIRLVDKFQADWLVLDGYQFLSNYQHFFHKNNIKTLLIDDLGKKGRYWADMILNQNIYAHEGLYDNRETYSKLLLGCKYTLLRKEFTAWRNWKREIATNVRRILVTLGGSDKDNMTARVIDGLVQIKRKNLDVTVIAGYLNPHYQNLLARTKKTQGSISLKTSIKDMPKLIAHSDLVIAAGGSTCYELAFMATPFITVVLSENQAKIASNFAKNGICVNLGWHQNISPDSVANVAMEVIENLKLRSKMSHRGKGIVDGYGAVKVVEAMDNYNPLM